MNQRKLPVPYEVFNAINNPKTEAEWREKLGAGQHVVVDFVLMNVLGEWFDKKLRELPPSLKGFVEEHLPNWEELLAEERRAKAIEEDTKWTKFCSALNERIDQQSASQNDPKTKPERDHFWNLICQIDSKTTEIADLAAMPTAVPSEARIKKEDLATLTSELEALDAQFRSPYPETQITPGEPTAPSPLTTGDIALCFAGLRWDEQGWKKPLGDKPKWLQACVAMPARRGVSETRWNPVCIAAALVRNAHASPRRVRAAFRTQPLLRPWLEAWKDYEAEYIEND